MRPGQRGRLRRRQPKRSSSVACPPPRSTGYEVELDSVAITQPQGRPIDADHRAAQFDDASLGGGTVKAGYADSVAGDAWSGAAVYIGRALQHQARSIADRD